MRQYLLAIFLLASPAVAAEPPLAIRNATVETLSTAGRLEKATVVIRDGKIAAVGKDVAIPEDASVLDAAGGTLMPGIIDPYFEVAIAAATPDTGTRSVTFGGRTINVPTGGRAGGGAFTRIADNFYPHDHGYRALPRIGLTRLNLVTGGVGQAAIVRVTPSDPEHMLDKGDGLAFASASNSSDSLNQIRTRLETAARAKRTGTTPSGGSSSGNQLWLDVHEGKSPLVVSVANPAAVLHLLKLLEPYKSVKPVLFLSGDAVAETIGAMKDAKVTVILRPGLDLVPNTRDRFNPARTLHEAGIDFSLSLTAKPPGAAPAAGEGEMTLAVDPECPLFPVAMLVKTGLPRQAALEALAKRPAKILGTDHLGTIEPGKAADLLLFTGDPLDPASKLRRTIIEGRTSYAN